MGKMAMFMLSGFIFILLVIICIVPHNVSSEEVWSSETVDIGHGHTTGMISMALDSKDYPHFVHQNYRSLEYVNWTGSDWHIEIIDYESYGVDTSLALDSQDRPHILYGSHKSLRYAYWTGEEWIREIVETGSSWPYDMSIAIDTNDIPHISYESPSGDLLKYGNRTNSSWQIEIIYGQVSGTSIVLDSNNYPLIALSEGSPSSLRYATWNGTEWDIKLVDSNGDVGRYPSIDLDSIELPHISYYDEGNRHLKYARNNGAGFIIETVDYADVGEYNSLVIDSFDYRHISYYDSDNISLRYAKWNGSTWNIEIVDSGLVGGYTSLDLDSMENPHIGYYNWTNNELKYAYWTGTDWDIQVVNTSGKVGEYSSLALDSFNYPHVSYYDNTNHDLKYANRTTSEWNIETVDSADDVGLFTSIAIDSENYPHISYFDLTHGYLKYANWTGSDWNIVFVDLLNDVGLYTSIAIDSFDYPHISYYDRTNGNLKYARWTGIIWDIEIIDFIDDVGMFSSIALDSNDFPHISYYDNTNGDLKYANWTGLAWNNSTIDSYDDVGRGSSIAIDTINRPHIVYLNKTNNKVKYANWTGSDWNLQIVASTTVQNETYFSMALDSSNNPHICYHYKFSNTNEFRQLEWNGSNWDIQVVIKNPFECLQPSIAIGSDDFARISYFNNGSYSLNLSVQFFNVDPIINVINPSTGNNQVDLLFNITWDDFDSDGNANITLWYNDYPDYQTTEIIEFSSTIIVTGDLKEDPDGPTDDSFQWNTTGVPDGTYYIYAIIDDGHNPKSWNRSLGTITIDHRPLAVISNPLSGFYSSDTIIYYMLIDPNSSPTDVYINWSLDGIDWFECTQGSGGEGKSGLSSSYPYGASHSFVWNTIVDLPDVNTTVYINITPYDLDLGEYDITSFVLDNENPRPILLTPQDNEHISNIFNLTASSDIDTASMEFYYYDGIWHFIDFGQYDSNSGEWYYNWNTSGMNFVSVIIYANATDGVDSKGNDSRVGIEIDNTPPTPVLLSPMNNEHITGIYNLTAISDPDTISVEFNYYDGSWQTISSAFYDSSSGNWYYIWDVSELDLIGIIVSVNTLDEVGLLGNASNIGIEIDNTHPNPNLLTPKNDEHISGMYNLTATCDPDTIALEFYYFKGDWYSIGSGTFDSNSGKWFYNWNTSGLNLYELDLSVNSTDEMWFTGTSLNTGIEIDNTPPSSTLLTPTLDEHITGVYNITAISSSDTVSLNFSYYDGIWHFIGNAFLDSRSSKWYLNWDTTAENLTGITLSANATDEIGLIGIDTNSGLEIDNSPPVPTLLTPMNNEHIQGVYNITAISDADTVLVEFYYYNGSLQSIGTGIYNSSNDRWFINWNTSSLNLNEVTIVVNVTDEIGFIGSYTITNLEIDNTPPNPTLLTPSENEHIKGVYNITALSDSDTTSLGFYYYGTVWHFIGTAYFDSASGKWFNNWDTTSLDLDSIQISVNSTDEMGFWGNVTGSGFTIDNTGPTIISITPKNNSNDIDVSTTIIIEFNESVNVLDFKDLISIEPSIDISSYIWNDEKNTLTIVPSSSLGQNKTYTVIINMDLKDINGNSMDHYFTSYFTTWLDTDDDGILDSQDNDDDDDGVSDSEDAFPLDPSESKDTDNDGIGNNADLDDDNDGHDDIEDAYPLDPTLWKNDDGTPNSNWIWYLIIIIIVVVIIGLLVFRKMGKNIPQDTVLANEEVIGVEPIYENDESFDNSVSIN